MDPKHNHKSSYKREEDSLTKKKKVEEGNVRKAAETRML